MRKFAFVILNNADSVIDRFNLDYVDGLSGLGFKLSISKIQTDIEDYITKIVQEKKNLGLTIHHIQGYKSANALRLWLAKHMNDCLCLEYSNSEKISYIAGKVQEDDETELNEYHVLEQKLTFTPTTPFFEKIDNDVIIRYSTIGKCYPYAYPYSYGQNIIENNEIENTYIRDIPIIVTLFGSMSNPDIKLIGEDGIIYNEVKFNDVDLKEGEKLIINSAQRKIIFEDSNGVQSDWFYKLDGAHDSYLRANPLEKSKIDISLSPTDSGYLIGSRRQYRL